ncbi:MAG: XdhC/CoxI family protein [Actinobacteria bacterium]|nr:XdhC/CoxI family protein [Actinomycetota bacterium]
MGATYEDILESLETTGRLALATLITRRGSAPGSLGAKMLIRPDGGTAGSIGGGCVEAEVWDAGRAVLESGEPQILAFRLNSADMAESGLICGGNVEILVEPLDSTHLPVMRGIVETRATKGRALLATVLPPGDGAAPVQPSFKVLLTPDGGVIGPGADVAPRDVLRAEGDKLPPGATRVVAGDEVAPGARVLLESIASPATLFVFGGGHLAEQIVPLAKRVHFHVTVVDDRPIFADPERFPEADEVLVSEFAEAFDRLAIDGSSFVVIVTRGHLHDQLCLEKSLETDAAYIGMVGSRAKIKKTYQELEAKGVPRGRLEQVHSPIGLPIHARLPEEIAVSIVAELIQVRNSRLFG